MLDSLFCRGNASKCKSLIKDIKSRVEVLRKKRNGKANLLRSDITQLLSKGQDQSALSRVDLLFAEENGLAVYDMIEFFCDCILKQLSCIQKHKDCPQDIKEAVSSLIFAAARCAEIPELQALRGIFATRYGDEFAIAAIELHPGCGVSQQIIEKLSPDLPRSDVKLNLTRKIAEKAGFQWEYSNLKSSSRKEDLGQVRCKEDICERVIPVVSTSVKEIPDISDNLEKTSQAEKPKSHSSSRRNVEKRAAKPVNWVDGVTYADCERTEQRSRANIIDDSFNTSLERNEVHEGTRQAYNRSWQDKNSKQSSGSERKNPYSEQRNGHTDTAFHEEGEYFHSKYTNGPAYTYFAEENRKFDTKYTNKHANASAMEENNRVPQKDLGLNSASLKSDVVYKSTLTDRASYLDVNGEKFQEFYEVSDNRKFPDNCNITREGSVKTGNGLTQYGENSVQNRRHGGHNSSSRCREPFVEDKEAEMFDKPCEEFHSKATQGGKSEYQDLPRNRREVRPKSKKMYSGSTWNDVEKVNVYDANYTDNSFSFPTNELDYTSVEPSIKKSTGRKAHNGEFLEPREGFTFKKVVVNYPDKWDPTSQYIGDQINKEVHNGLQSSCDNDDYSDGFGSSDHRFVRVDKTYAAEYGPSPVHERLHSRESGRRAYYTNVGGMHEEAKHNLGSKSVNTKFHEVANALQQFENEEEHEIYERVQETFYDSNGSNLNSFGRAPHESRKHTEKGEQKSNHAFRETERLHSPDYLSRKDLYGSTNHASNEEQNLQQSDSVKVHTKHTYLHNIGSIKRSDVGLQTQENKPQFGGKIYQDSLKVHDNHVKQHPELHDNHFQKSESCGRYMNETNMTPRHAESSYDRNNSSLNDNSILPEQEKDYSVKREQIFSGLKDIRQSDGSAQINRHHSRQSERKQKVSVCSDSNVQLSEPTNSHPVFSGNNGISEAKESSPKKVRRQDIKHAKSHRTRNAQRAHEIQSNSQPEYSESTSVKNTFRSAVPSAMRIVKSDSHDLPNDLSINRPLPPLPPLSPAPKPSCVSQEDRLHKSSNPVNGFTPQRPPQEHQRAVSMPSKSPSRSASMQARLVKSSSDVGISSTRHVHPKLPDYDDLTAHFAALKQQCKPSNSE